MKVKILVAHHKPGLVISNNVYMPIQVGKEKSTYDLNIIGDNEGDNISLYNPVFCEMTAVYWAWKNLSADYIGLCHYRRYFTFKRNYTFKAYLKYWSKRLFGNVTSPGEYSLYQYKNQLYYKNVNSFQSEAIKFMNDLSSVLSKETSVDAVVPKPFLFPCASIRLFFDILGRDHIALLRDVVKTVTPDFYTYVDKTLMSNKLYAANMFIFKEKIFKDYCDTIFPVLFEHLERVKKTGWCIDPLNERCYSRISGYLAEILTSSYILKLIMEKKEIVYAKTMFLSM